MNEKPKITSQKLSDPIHRLEKPLKIDLNDQKMLFAYFNFGIANLERIIELAKFLNENFSVCNYIFQKAETIRRFRRQIKTYSSKTLELSIYLTDILYIMKLKISCKYGTSG